MDHVCLSLYYNIIISPVELFDPVLPKKPLKAINTSLLHIPLSSIEMDYLLWKLFSLLSLLVSFAACFFFQDSYFLHLLHLKKVHFLSFFK